MVDANRVEGWTVRILAMLMGRALRLAVCNLDDAVRAVEEKSVFCTRVVMVVAPSGKPRQTREQKRGCLQLVCSRIEGEERGAVEAVLSSNTTLLHCRWTGCGKSSRPGVCRGRRIGLAAGIAGRS